MHIAFLCKRRYMSKDVIVDRYARLYEIPFQLAQLGHDVRGYCLSYGSAEEGEWEHLAQPGRLSWESCSLGRWKLPRLIAYTYRLQRRLREFHPDVIICASDIPHIVLGARMAKRFGLPLAADLYDNFEGFGQARIPGFVPALRCAVQGAQLVTTTSEPLADYVRSAYHTRGKVAAMPSTVDKATFHPRDKLTCRRVLGLPEDAYLIGTAGGLMENRGIATLYEAWRLLASQGHDVHLVLAGPPDEHCPPPDDAHVHYLGVLPHERIAELFCALDVGVIYLRDTAFGRFCFPQKAYEMMSSELPVVAAAVGVLPSLLRETPEFLYKEGNSESLANALILRLRSTNPSNVPIEDWTQIVARYEIRLREVTSVQSESR